MLEPWQSAALTNGIAQGLLDMANGMRTEAAENVRALFVVMGERMQTLGGGDFTGWEAELAALVASCVMCVGDESDDETGAHYIWN